MDWVFFVIGLGSEGKGGLLISVYLWLFFCWCLKWVIVDLIGLFVVVLRVQPLALVGSGCMLSVVL